VKVAYIFSSQGHTVSYKLGKLVNGAVIGCFPDLYEALSGNMPDQVITL
jgi:hypothetical protein